MRIGVLERHYNPDIHTKRNVALLHVHTLNHSVKITVTVRDVVSVNVVLRYQSAHVE